MGWARAVFVLFWLFVSVVVWGQGYSDVAWMSDGGATDKVWFSHDGHYATSKTTVWDTQTGETIFILQPTGPIDQACVSSDGRAYFSGNIYSNLTKDMVCVDLSSKGIVWTQHGVSDTVIGVTESTGELVTSFSNKTRIRSSLDGSFLRDFGIGNPSFVTDDGRIVVWVGSNVQVFEPEFGSVVQTISLTNWITSSAHSVNGRYFMTTDDGGSGHGFQMYRYSIDTGLLNTGAGGSTGSKFFSPAISNDGQLIATGTPPGATSGMVVRDSHGQILRTTSVVGDVMAFRPGGAMVWLTRVYGPSSALQGRSFRFCDASTGIEIFPSAVGSRSNRPAFSRDDQSVFENGSLIARFDRFTGNPAWIVDPGRPYPNQMTLAARGSRLACFTFKDPSSEYRLYDTNGSLVSRSVSDSSADPYRTGTTSSFDGLYTTVVFPGTAHFTLRLYSLVSGSLANSVTLPNSFVRIHMTPDGSQLFVTDSALTLTVLALPSLQIMRTIPGQCCGIAPNGMSYVWISDESRPNGFEVRNTSNDSTILAVPLPGTYNHLDLATWDPDGSTIFGNYEDSAHLVPEGLYVWNAETGELLGMLGPQGKGFYECAVSHDGKSIVLGNQFGQLMMCNNRFHGMDYGKTMSWSVPLGTTIDGAPADLRFFDNVTASLQTVGGRLVVEADATASPQVGSSAVISVRARSSNPGNFYAVSAFNWTTGQYVSLGTIDPDSHGGQGSLTVPDPGRFVRSGDNEVRTRISLVTRMMSTNTFTIWSNPSQVWIDEVAWSF